MPTVVSVLMCAYNAENCVAAAVRSALEQTFENLEVILVDDGSQDNTLAAAREAAGGDPRYRDIRLPSNRGPAAARNAGIRQAAGQWIAPLDADDVFLPRRLEYLVPRAEQLKADLLADNLFVARTNEPWRTAFALPKLYEVRPMSATSFIKLDTEPLVGLTDGRRSAGPRFLPLAYMHPLIRRGFIEQHELLYPEDIRYSSDFHFYVMCLLRGARLFLMQAPHYVWHDRPGSVSHADPTVSLPVFKRSMAMLHEEARRLGHREAARSLAQRVDDRDTFFLYSRFSEALHRRRPLKATLAFRELWRRRYTWRRLGSAVRRRLHPVRVVSR